MPNECVMKNKEEAAHNLHSTENMEASAFYLYKNSRRFLICAPLPHYALRTPHYALKKLMPHFLFGTCGISLFLFAALYEWCTAPSLRTTRYAFFYFSTPISL